MNRSNIKLKSNTTFKGLLDTPNEYSNFENYIVSVNSNGTGLEFIEPISGITNPSQGAENNLNVSDGAGGFKESDLKVVGDKISYKSITGAGIQILDGDEIYLKSLPEVVLQSNNPVIRDYEGSQFTPTNDNHITNKKYVDDSIISTFTGLTDTPNEYSNFENYIVSVNSNGTGLEFIEPISGITGTTGVSTFTGLTDTPNDYVADQYIKVNSGGTALEYNPLGSMADKDFWTGTQAEYDGIATPESNTIYFIEEE